MKKKSLIIILFIFMIALTSMGTTVALGEELSFGSAKSAILLDADSGTVVYQKNSGEKRQIASMVKIMTLNILFDEIEAGNIALDEMVTVSEYATSMGGSQAFLDANCDYKVEELIKSIIVASANDSCVAMAERVSGSVGAFVQRMNDLAEELGMENTRFVNCTGLPDLNQYSCANDVSIMMRRLIKNDKFFGYAKIWTFDFEHPSGRKTTLTNTNKLVRFYSGCDGGKTGYTSEAMSCLSATAKRGDTRFLCVVMGASDSKSRNAEVSKLFDYGFANYEKKVFVQKGLLLEDRILVNGGREKFTTGIVESDLFAFSKRNENKDFATEIEYFDISAPINRGEVVGEIKLIKNGEVVSRSNILSNATVKRQSYYDIIDKIVQKW